MRKALWIIGLAAFLTNACEAAAAVRCTRETAPVCARGAEGVRTYNNANCARAAHARILRAGHCRHQIEPVLPSPYGPERCTMEDRPVCAEFGSTRLTFPNACHAVTAGATIVTWGACWY